MGKPRNRKWQISTSRILKATVPEALNLSAGERVRGAFHIQTVNSRHSQLKDFLRCYRGIATKYLGNYLQWFHLIKLAPQPSSRACLAAVITRRAYVS